MSSSEVRIIKDAKISRDPVVIAMHDFSELNPLELAQIDADSEGAGIDGVLETEEESKEPPIPVVVVRPEEEIIREAQEQAQTILTAAEAEAGKLKTQAAADGKKQGLAEAVAQMAQQVKENAERANSILAAADNEASRILSEAEPKIIELVLAISQKVINDEVEERPGIVLALVREALDKVRDQNQIIIHVSPADYEFILQSRLELQTMVGAEQSLNIVADPVLNKGDCLIDTAFGTVEAGIDMKFEAIRLALLGMAK